MSFAVQLTLCSSWPLTGRRSAPGELSSSPHYLQPLTCSGKWVSGRQVLRMAWTTTARQGIKASQFRICSEDHSVESKDQGNGNPCLSSNGCCQSTLDHSLHPRKLGASITHDLWMRKLRYGELQWLTQDHTFSLWQSRCQVAWLFPSTFQARDPCHS